jgi:hypothetical protein
MDVTGQRANLWEPRKHDIPEEYDPDKRAFREVCSGICSSGDRLGEFWTCSFLGPFSTIEKAHPVVNEAYKPAQVFDADKITYINERYKFDKYSARNLVFLVQPTRLIWILSGLYEGVGQYLESIIRLYVRPFSPRCTLFSTNSIIGY